MSVTLSNLICAWAATLTGGGCANACLGRQGKFDDDLCSLIGVPQGARGALCATHSKVDVCSLHTEACAHEAKSYWDGTYSHPMARLKEWQRDVARESVPRGTACAGDCDQPDGGAARVCRKCARWCAFACPAPAPSPPCMIVAPPPPPCTTLTTTTCAHVCRCEGARDADTHVTQVSFKPVPLGLTRTQKYKWCDERHGARVEVREIAPRDAVWVQDLCPPWPMMFNATGGLCSIVLAR